MLQDKWSNLLYDLASESEDRQSEARALLAEILAGMEADLENVRQRLAAAERHVYAALHPNA